MNFEVSMLNLKNIHALLRNKANNNKEYSNDDAFFNQLRRNEFSRLQKGNHVYLDYTGGCLYPESLVKAHQEYLLQAVYGNPHSTNPASILSEKYVNDARERVLNFFNASD